MRSRRCSGPGRPSGDTKASGRRVTSKAPLGPTWKEGQAGPRRCQQPFSRILTAWKANSANFALTEFYEFRPLSLASFLLRRIVSAPVIKALSHTPPAAYPAKTSLK